MADWAHLYKNSLPTEDSSAISSATESTVVTTTSIGTSSLTNNVQSRSGKPARRRSRASRKAPTTLVSTNTNDFRAMVQQFTGFPTGRHQQQQPAVVYQPVAGRVSQFNQLQHQVVQPFGGVQAQQTHELLFQNQQQQQMFDLRNSNVEGQLMGVFGGNQRPDRDFSGGFLMKGMSSSSSPSQQQVVTSTVLQHLPTYSSSTDANGGFILK